MFFLVVAMLLLCRGVAYAYSPSANDPISKSGGIEQDIPPPHIPPPPLPSQIFLHVGETSETPYPMIGAMVWECDNPPVGIEQEESYIFGTMIILRIKGVAAGRYQVDMKWYNPLNPGQPPLGRQTIEVIVQPWP
ncbi:hypothetical protein [Bacteroides fragilis]|uniref:hypothetical protein n=1 Tax=Bacteroides fragilis TaxID=817 RepID=UPI002365B202|nr:hypothetical protein [Bacteroides fragilis]